MDIFALIVAFIALFVSAAGLIASIASKDWPSEQADRKRYASVDEHADDTIGTLWGTPEPEPAAPWARSHAHHGM